MRLRDVAWKKWLEGLGPGIAIGLGVVSQGLAGRTFAVPPKAVALLVVAWAVAAAAGQWLPAPREGEPHPRWRRLARAAASTVTVSLMRNVLFFLVPIWFASATFGSVNMLFPL